MPYSVQRDGSTLHIEYEMVLHSMILPQAAARLGNRLYMFDSVRGFAEVGFISPTDNSIYESCEASAYARHPSSPGSAMITQDDTVWIDITAKLPRPTRSLYAQSGNAFLRISV